tara:strand:+ start:1581 stop:3590 length:2010 start_codon:yes stop_codon:yes gene_type:complete
MGFLDVNTDNWIKNSSPSSTSAGKCSSNLNDDSIKKPNGNYGNKRPDFYICGDKTEGNDCIGATEDEFKNVVKNCITKDSDGNLYKIPCANMLTTDDNPVKDFSMGWRTNCNDNNIYDPNTGTCDTDCDGGNAGEFFGRIAAGLATLGVSEIVIAAEGSLSEAGCGGQGSNSYGNPGGEPAFGYWDSNKMWAVPKNIQGVKDLGINKTSDDDDTGSCPATHTKEFMCAGDGVGGIGLFGGTGAVPGCASGRDISGVEGAIRFCARNDESYQIKKLMNCCLTERGDDDELRHSMCPVGYCRTKVNYQDAIESERCKIPVGSDLFNQDCYQMTNECNELFKDECTSDVFGRRDDSDDEKIACIKWSKIQKDDFNTVAENICSIGAVVFGDDYDGTQTNQDIIDEIINNSQNIQPIVDIFKSDICRDWLIESGNSKLLLNELCSVGSQPNSDGTFDVNSYNDPTSGDLDGALIDVCHCYWSDEYYRWYKDNVLSEEERNTIGQNVRPECFHRRCMLSGTYTTEDNTECPSIISCKNEINTHILNMGDSNNRNTGDYIDSIESSLANNQACNINAINQNNAQQGNTTTGSTTTGSTTTGSTNNVTDSSTGEGAEQSGTGSDGATYTGGSQRNDDGTSSNDPEDNNTLLIIGLVAGGILLLMLMVIMAGGSKRY